MHAAWAGVSPRMQAAIVAVAAWTLSWTVWYFAVWIGIRLQNNVFVSRFDFIPGLSFTASLVFVVPWSGTGFNAAVNAPRRTGGMCTPMCCKAVGAISLFTWGVMDGLWIVLFRFFLILPDEPTPKSTLPGWLFLLHLALQVLTVERTLAYSNTRERPSAQPLAETKSESQL